MKNKSTKQDLSTMKNKELEARKIKIISRIILSIVLLFCIWLIYVLLITRQDKVEHTWKAYRSLLQDNEEIIDAVQDKTVQDKTDQDKSDQDKSEQDKSVQDKSVQDNVIQHNTMTYMITSREGRTDYGDTIAIFEQHPNMSVKRIYNNDFNQLKPWKIDLADIDGDGKKELITAVHKTAHFDDVEKNRLFIFNYTKGKLVKKWTGSEIAGDWEDFVVGDLVDIKGDELLFIRKTDVGDRVSTYYWFDFGFLMLAESKDYENITNISIKGENCILMTYRKEEKKHTVTLAIQEGKLVEVLTKN